MNQDITVNVYEELSESSRKLLLSRMLQGPCSVSQLVEGSGLKQPNVSNHLARLRSKGLVQTCKIGRQVFYSIASSDVEAKVRTFLNQGLEPVPTVRLPELAKDYAKAAVRGDEPACSKIMDLAIQAKCPIIDIYQDLLGAAMYIVGTWYKVEAIDEGQEHMASEITLRMMSKSSLHFEPRAKTNLSAILGCAPGSWHVIGIRMIADYLKFAGWKVQFLGADVPVVSFMEAVHNNRPDVVLINCNAAESVAPSLRLTKGLADLRNDKLQFLIGVGGRSAQNQIDSFKESGADFTSQDLRSFATDILPEIDRIGRSSKRWDLGLPNGFAIDDQSFVSTN